LRCLAVLPALRELVISESPLYMGFVITDTLLQGPVYRSGTTELIPRLDFLALTSLLGFTDALYIAVVASRVERYTTLYIDKSCIFETHL
jgi:hypothetical protein